MASAVAVEPEMSPIHGASHEDSDQDDAYAQVMYILLVCTLCSSITKIGGIQTACLMWPFIQGDDIDFSFKEMSSSD